jgi:hypothetical protein
LLNFPFSGIAQLAHVSTPSRETRQASQDNSIIDVSKERPLPSISALDNLIGAISGDDAGGPRIPRT